MFWKLHLMLLATSVLAYVVSTFLKGIEQEKDGLLAKYLPVPDASWFVGVASEVSGVASIGLSVLAYLIVMVS